MRHRDDGYMDRMRQGIPRGFDGATTTGNGEHGPGRVPSRTERGRVGNAQAIRVPLSRDDPELSHGSEPASINHL